MRSRKASRSPISAAHQQAYERFETVRLAADEALLKRFVFLLGADRVVPAHRECHLYELLRASETVGRTLTNQFYALYADIRQRVLTRLCRENATVAPPEILRCTQKLLDRVLFCAFCEDRGLLPAESLKRAFEHRDPYNPHPLWHNFRGLFRAIDEGNAGLNIWQRVEAPRRNPPPAARGRSRRHPRKALANPHAYDLNALNESQRQAFGT